MWRSRRAQKSEGSPRDKQNELYVNYKLTKCKLRNLHRLAKQDWTQKIFDEIDKAAKIDKVFFYRTAWKNNKPNKYTTTFQVKI